MSTHIKFNVTNIKCENQIKGEIRTDIKTQIQIKFISRAAQQSEDHQNTKKKNFKRLQAISFVCA